MSSQLKHIFLLKNYCKIFAIIKYCSYVCSVKRFDKTIVLLNHNSLQKKFLVNKLTLKPY